MARFGGLSLPAAAAAAVVALWAGAGACGPATPRRLVRLGELVALPKTTAPIALPAGAASPTDPYRADPGLSAGTVRRLPLRARRDARPATLPWKAPAHPRRLPPFPHL